MEISAHWLLFIPASLALICTPGQDMLLVMQRSLGMGAKAGLITAAGISLGLVGHSLLAALGLGALLTASETIFTIFKLLGAAYLVYLGIQLLRYPGQTLLSTNTQQCTNLPSAPSLKLLWQGAISNLSNPKIAVFYFAFLPQFVPAEAANPSLSIFFLGMIFALLTLLVKAPLGLAASAVSGQLQAKPMLLRGLDQFCGLVLIGLAAKLVLSRSSH